MGAFGDSESDDPTAGGCVYIGADKRASPFGVFEAPSEDDDYFDDEDDEDLDEDDEDDFEIVANYVEEEDMES